MQEIMKTKTLGNSPVLRLCFAAATFLLPAIASAEAIAAEPIGIAAKVNGHVITKNELTFLMTPKWKELNKRFPDHGEEFEQLLSVAREQVIKELGDRRMYNERFNHLDIQIAPALIDEEVKLELSNNFHDKPARLRDALKSSRLTMDGFRALLHERLLERVILRIQRDMPCTNKKKEA